VKKEVENDGKTPASEKNYHYRFHMNCAIDRKKRTKRTVAWATGGTDAELTKKNIGTEEERVPGTPAKGGNAILSAGEHLRKKTWEKKTRPLKRGGGKSRQANRSAQPISGADRGENWLDSPTQDFLNGVVVHLGNG